MLSIILPCYNEGKKMKNTIEQINDYFESVQIDSYEIIIVNDGSKDNTFDEIVKLKEQYPNLIKIIHYTHNKGKGYAVKRGILDSTGDYVLFMDSDLSTDLSAIKECYDNKENSIIIASRNLKESKLVVSQGIVRKFTGKMCTILTNMLLNLKIKDTQCGFKFFKRETALQLVNKQTLNGWAFDVELLYIAKLNNVKVKEIPIIWTNDNDSKVSTLSASFKFLSDLFYIRNNKKMYLL